VAAPNKYKLIYFDGLGRAEVTRLLFQATNTHFEDVRFTSEQWAAEWKNKMPFKQVPVLEFNGKIIPESHVIERFVAGQVGLNGANPLEAAEIDVVVEWTEEVKTSYRKVRSLPEADREAAKKKFFAEEMPPFLKNLEHWLATLGYSGPFLVGSKLSLADIIVYHNFTAFWDDKDLVNAALHGHSRVLSSISATGQHAVIAPYVAGRKKTPF